MACGRPVNNWPYGPPSAADALRAVERGEDRLSDVRHRSAGPGYGARPGLASGHSVATNPYRRFVRALDRGSRLIRLDKRGTGLSDPARELPAIEERVEDLAAVMAGARSSRAVLFGMSDGGRAAIAFAAAHPGRTQGLLYGTSYRGPRAALLRQYRSVARHWGKGGWPPWSRPAYRGRRRVRPPGRSSGRRPARPWRRH